MTKHHLTDIDLDIIKYLYNLKGSETITTYSLAKKIFNSDVVSNKNRFYSDKQKYIDYRMQKLKDVGIINISKINNKKLFTLILNNVYFRKFKDKKREIDAQAIFLKINNDWNIYLTSF